MKFIGYNMVELSNGFQDRSIKLLKQRLKRKCADIHLRLGLPESIEEVVLFVISKQNVVCKSQLHGLTICSEHSCYM